VPVFNFMFDLLWTVKFCNFFKFRELKYIEKRGFRN